MSVVYELSEFTIQEGRETEFEGTMLVAREVIGRTPGLESIEYWRCIETPNVYALLLKWRSMEAHLVEWRNSPLYAEWSALVVPFIEGTTPRDAHFAPCGSPYTGKS